MNQYLYKLSTELLFYLIFQLLIMFWLSSIIDTKSAGLLGVCLYKESGQELHKAQGESAGVRSGPFPEGAGCFSLCLASGIDMAYSFPQSKKELQRRKHTRGWLLMRLSVSSYISKSTCRISVSGLLGICV